LHGDAQLGQKRFERQGFVTRDEHREIIAFIDAVTRPQAEPALDVEADAIIRALFVRNPEAAYRVTKFAMAQRAELAEMRLRLAEARAEASAHWLSRLWKKPARQTRIRRLDPNFPRVSTEST